MIIVNVVSRGAGWYPINHMVNLAGEMFGVEVIEAPLDDPTLLARCLSILFRRRSNSTSPETCLVIGANPTALLKIIGIDGWRSRFRSTAAWIIDSMWIDHIPRTISLSNPFDHIFITSGEDLGKWTDSVKSTVSWLPWGTDVLRLGGGSPTAREWDLTRVGRQPPEWDDDDTTSAAASQLGIRFHPRPPASGSTPAENQELLMKLYRRTKFLLAFSNAVNPEHYTHPTTQYLTGRWVDALGCGAVVAGATPRGTCIDSLLWPGATLELETTRRQSGFEVLQSALADWTPAVAQRNHALALQRLDWRWRFKSIAEVLGESPVRLNQELGLLQAAIDANPYSESSTEPR